MIEKGDRVLFYFDWLLIGVGRVEGFRGDYAKIRFYDYQGKSYILFRPKHQLWHAKPHHEGVQVDWFLIVTVGTLLFGLSYLLLLTLRS